MAARISLATAWLFLAAIGGREAKATCGDYVMVGGEPARHHETRPGSNADRSPSLDDFHGTAGCQGPNCQRRRLPPVSPQRGNDQANGSDWALWHAAIHVTTRDHRRAPIPEMLLAPEGCLVPLLRPPCFNAPAILA